MGEERTVPALPEARLPDEPYAAPRIDDLGELERLTLGSLQDA
ncbi:MAG: hypothetical protein R3C15_03615 [Thermoleophilia bacterium]